MTEVRIQWLQRLRTATLEAFPDRYELSFRDSSGHHPLGAAPTAPLSSESAGGFTGVYIGLFASNPSSARMAPADFDWFEYEPAGD